MTCGPSDEVRNSRGVLDRPCLEAREIEAPPRLPSPEARRSRRRLDQPCPEARPPASSPCRTVRPGRPTHADAAIRAALSSQIGATPPAALLRGTARRERSSETRASRLPGSRRRRIWPASRLPEAEFRRDPPSLEAPASRRLLDQTTSRLRVRGASSRDRGPSAYFAGGSLKKVQAAGREGSETHR